MSAFFGATPSSDTVPLISPAVAASTFLPPPPDAAGGANPGGYARLNDHFLAFIANGRAVNPVTKTNWEGVGVEPDVKVKAEDALTTAHVAAIEALKAKTTDPELVAMYGRALDMAKGTMKP